MRPLEKHPRRRVIAIGMSDAAMTASAASLLIAAGVELVEVSQLLGHSELRVTADLYAHLQKQTAAKAAKVMDTVLGG